MIQGRWHSRTGWLLSLVYLLATTAGGLFHDHAHEHAGHDHKQGHCEQGHCHHHHVAEAHDHDHDAHDHDAAECHEHDHAEPGCLACAGEVESSDDEQALVVSPVADDDSDCIVCRFLAQKPTPIHVVTILACSQSVAAVPAPAPIGPVAPLARTLHSRAPPTLA